MPTTSRTFARVIAALLALAMLHAAARADETHCRAIDGGAPVLESIDATTRLAFLRERLRVGARHARAWQYTWTGLYGGLATTQLALLGTASDRDSRINYGIGGGAALLGLSVQWIMPPKVMLDQPWLERRIRRSPADESPCALVAEAERLLLRDAAAERFGKSALIHAGNFAFNIGLVLLLGLGFDHWSQAAITGPVGIIVGELQTFTQPGDEVKTLARYRRGELNAAEYERAHVALAPIIAHDRMGLTLAISF